MQKSCYEHRNSTDTRQSTCYIGTLYSQANIIVKMLKITYVKRQLADDSENKISFVAISGRSVLLKILENSHFDLDPIARAWFPIYRFRRHNNGKQVVDAVSNFSVIFLYLRCL